MIVRILNPLNVYLYIYIQATSFVHYWNILLRFLLYSHHPGLESGNHGFGASNWGTLAHLDLRGFSLGRWRWGCVKLVLLFQSMISKAVRAKPVVNSVEGLRIFISHWFRLVGWTHQQYYPEGKWNTWRCSDSLPCTGFGSQVWLHNCFDWKNYGFEFLA